MRAALGTTCRTLYRGEEDLHATLDGVTKLLARAPAQLLDRQYSVAIPFVHGLPGRPAAEASSVEVGAVAE